MGLWATIKGWFNIGGVKVLLWKYSEPLKRSAPVITGAVLLKTKTPKTILSTTIELIEEHTTGSGDKRKTETTVLGRINFPEHGPGLGYPVELKPGEDLEEPFSLNVAVTQRLKDSGGVLGAVGKIAAFASSEKTEFFLVARADVKGTAFDPSHKVKMPIAD